MVKGKSLWIAAMAAAVGAFASSAAQADVAMYAPNALKPPSSGGMSTLSAGTGWTCNLPYVTVAGQWNSFATGSCLQGNASSNPATRA